MCQHAMRKNGLGEVTQRCVSLVEPGQRYCPAHRHPWTDNPKPRVKHDLDLDVLPWQEKSFGK